MLEAIIEYLKPPPLPAASDLMHWQALATFAVMGGALYAAFRAFTRRPLRDLREALLAAFAAFGAFAAAAKALEIWSWAPEWILAGIVGASGILVWATIPFYSLSSGRRAKETV